VGIVDEDVARVRAASDLVAIASEHIALKRVGRRWVGLCPFHAEKTPSFSINGELGLYYCFGCGAKGDVITFVREVEHLDFAAAVERLAAKAGISLRYDDAVTSRERQRRERLLEAMRAAVDWYHQRLLAAPDAGRARAYLRSRGYDREVVARFKLGWAPDEWDALARALALPDDVLRDTGLGFVNRAGRQQDAFRARVMFPIFDVRGEPVAFGGRALGGEGPKYKNSPETPLYAKSRTLYGLNWAKAEIVKAGEVIVCEGYTDVIGFALAGLPRAVATCGTALADEHFRILKNFARRIVLAYDADAAGQAAAERFYEWERRYEVDIAVAELPAGTDPADLARADPAALREAVAAARPFLGFRVERAIRRGGDMRAPEDRARAARAALAVIREHPDPLVRDQYVMAVADRCRIEAERLREWLRRPPRGAEAQAAPARRASRRPVASRVVLPRDAEENALVLMIHDPASVAGRLHEALFTDEVHLAAYRALASAPDLHAAVGAAGPEAGALLQRLALEESDADPGDVVAVLALRAATAALERYTAEARSAEDPAAYAPVTSWLGLMVSELRDPDTRVQAAEQLVAWLADQLEEHR
jgi:DNA primase